MYTSVATFDCSVRVGSSLVPEECKNSLYWFWCFGWKIFTTWASHCTEINAMPRRHDSSWRVKKSCIAFVWGVPGFSFAKERSRPYFQLPSALKLKVCQLCYSGDFGDDKHFSMREISIDATHLGLDELLLFFIFFKNQICFAFFSQLLQLPWFLALDDGGKTHYHWHPE